jgi:rhamnose utilization protein RhaD (predicted bifunctional aldolase and dehydrogenase)
VHTHPALVNGVTCSAGGEAAAKELFGDAALWLPIIDPGYTLFCAVKKALAKYGAAPPRVILLQNHGVFVGADSTEEVKKIYDEIMGKIAARVQREPDFENSAAVFGDSARVEKELAETAATENGGSWTARFLRNNEIAKLTENRAAFQPVSSAFTPDHIVYAGSDSLFVERDEDRRAAFRQFKDKTGRTPKIIVIAGTGVFGLGTSEKAAKTALELFLDAARIACYADSFGGPLFMTREKIDFINNWEVERYRSSASLK